jgi:hypothetical protein
MQGRKYFNDEEIIDLKNLGFEEETVNSYVFKIQGETILSIVASENPGKNRLWMYEAVPRENKYYKNSVKYFEYLDDAAIEYIENKVLEVIEKYKNVSFAELDFRDLENLIKNIDHFTQYADSPRWAEDRDMQNRSRIRVLVDKLKKVDENRVKELFAKHGEKY